MANVDNVTVRSKHCRECGICFAVNPADEIKKQVEIIVRETVNKLAGQNPKIPIGVSNRHIHISREILDRLYGKDYQLNKLRDLYQTGEFAAKETLTVIGPKMKAIENIRILGPIRNYTQVELSKTDGVYL